MSRGRDGIISTSISLSMLCSDIRRCRNIGARPPAITALISGIK